MNLFYKYLVINCLCFVSISLNAQKVVIANTQMNVVFVGVQNPIEVAVSGYSSENIGVKVSQGIIMKTDSQYIWQPITPTNEAFIIIFLKKGEEEEILEKIKYRVKKIPSPTARICPLSQTGIDGVCLFSSRIIGLIASLDNFDYNVEFVITSFKVAIVRDGKNIFEGTNQGGRFRGQVQLMLSTIEVGDMVYFTDVQCQCPGDKKPRKINNLVFRIR